MAMYLSEAPAPYDAGQVNGTGGTPSERMGRPEWRSSYEDVLRDPEEVLEDKASFGAKLKSLIPTGNGSLATETKAKRPIYTDVCE